MEAAREVTTYARASFVVINSVVILELFSTLPIPLPIAISKVTGSFQNFGAIGCPRIC